MWCLSFFFFQAEDGIRDIGVTGVQTCALPISPRSACGRRRATAGSGSCPTPWGRSPAGRSRRSACSGWCGGPGGGTPPQYGERRGGEGGRTRGGPCHLKKTKKAKSCISADQYI